VLAWQTQCRGRVLHRAERGPGMRTGCEPVVEEDDEGGEQGEEEAEANNDAVAIGLCAQHAEFQQ